MQRASTSRRSLSRLTLAVALAALLGACGGGGNRGVQSPAAEEPAARVALAPLYSVTYLNITLGGSTSQALDINNKGQVTGSASAPYFDMGERWHAILYSNGITQAIVGTSYRVSRGYGINNNAQITGFVASAVPAAFLYSHGAVQGLGYLPGGGVSSGIDINDYGQVAGWATTNGNANTNAFLYSDGIMQDLGTLGGSYSSGNGINVNGQVAGTSELAGDVDAHAFLYSDGTMRDLGTLGGSSSSGNAINAKGQVVGSSKLAGDVADHAFLYSRGTMRDLGTLGGSSSGAADINDKGQVVGSSQLAGDVALRAFVYIDGTMYDLNNLLDSSGAGSNFIEALAINNPGQILVSGSVNGQSGNFVLTPVPRGKR